MYPPDENEPWAPWEPPLEYWEPPEEAPHYTPIHAVTIVLGLIAAIMIIVAIALAAREVLTPLPYRDPEPPSAT